MNEEQGSPSDEGVACNSTPPMTPYRVGLNLAAKGRRLPRLLRRHPLALISLVGLFLFLSVFFLADTHDKNESLLYAPGYLDVKNDPLFTNTQGNNQSKSQASKSMLDEGDSGYFRLDQAARRKRILDVCSEARPTGIVSTLLISKQSNLTYCPIPRSSNTFWIQVLRFLNRDYLGSNPDSPFDIDPEEIYERPLLKTQMVVWKLTGDKEKDRLHQTKIFLSVQNPYMRLWSTYIHALLLPELWGSIGQKIEARRPRPPPQPIAFFQPRRPVRCGHDVTFAEFIAYVLESYEKDFAPYYRLCDPCQLRPHYVIKAETARRDNGFVLKDVSLAWTVNGSEAERKSLTQYVTSFVSGSFKRMKNAPPKECNMTLVDVAHRLWQAFVVEGVVPEHSEPPSFEGMDQSQFVHLVLDRATVEQLDRRWAQKRKYMAAAFRNLSAETLKKVQEKYDMDFRLFDYDKTPLDIAGLQGTAAS